LDLGFWILDEEMGTRAVATAPRGQIQNPQSKIQNV
jgi:hypothetical protein